jgi:3-hydroxyisobutyrate dehydrogenase
VSQQKERIGVVGAGRMGLPMVKHLIRQGYQVHVMDISEANLAKAKELGAQVVATPAELGKQTDFVILGVGYDDEVRQVTLGKDGLLETLASGAIIAVSSTVAPDTVKGLAAAAAEKGVGVLDAPICRGRWFADEGKLLALFGGTDNVVERGRKVYGTFSSDIVHLGEVGHGQVAKAMNNLLLWVNSLGIMEAGWIAESTGIDLQKLREALMMSSGKSQALEDWEQTTFTWALKDMQIVSLMTDKANLSLPLTGAVREMVKEARKIKANNPPRWSEKQV